MIRRGVWTLPVLALIGFDKNMKILYDFYLSSAYSYARVKKSKKVKMHTSQRPKRPELVQVSSAWSTPRRTATLPSTAVREFRANFPSFYRSLQHTCFASCFKHYPLLFEVIQKCRTIFIAMLRLYGTRGDTKIWAKIISACAKKCSRDEGFRRWGEEGGAKNESLNRPLGAWTHTRAICWR